VFRPILSIIFFILAGVVLYLIEVIAFYRASEANALKLFAMIALILPAAVLLFTGHTFVRFQGWKRHTGMVLIGTTLFAIFIGVTLLCMSLSEGFVQGVGTDALPAFNDYALGVPFVVAILSLGLFLCCIDKKAAE
jgi:uncharacterized membrane protein YozB (DUF420 family)